MKNKGITLVALVITIIILLILAGITISQLTGSGLFEKAKRAEEKTKNAQNEENTILSDYDNMINSYINKTNSNNNEVKNEDEEEKTIILEENLIDYWSLEDSLENKKGTDDLVIYKGSNMIFENESVYLNDTVLTTSQNYALPKNFTIIFKYKPTEELKAWTLILGKITNYYYLSTYNGLFIHGDTATTRLCAGTNSSYFSIDKILTVGNYSTFAITYDGTDSKLYRDGELITQVVGYNDLGSQLFIGGSIYSGTNTAAEPWDYANGYFKDIMIYNTALSQEQVNTIE